MRLLRNLVDDGLGENNRIKYIAKPGTSHTVIEKRIHYFMVLIAVIESDKSRSAISMVCVVGTLTHPFYGSTLFRLHRTSADIGPAVHEYLTKKKR
jgi:hypothetical protein